MLCTAHWLYIQYTYICTYVQINAKTMTSNSISKLHIRVCEMRENSAKASEAAVHHTSKLSGLFCVYVIYDEIGLFRFGVAFALCFVVFNKSRSECYIKWNACEPGTLNVFCYEHIWKVFRRCWALLCARNLKIYSFVNARKCKASIFNATTCFVSVLHTPMFLVLRVTRVLYMCTTLNK